MGWGMVARADGVPQARRGFERPACGAASRAGCEEFCSRDPAAQPAAEPAGCGTSSLIRASRAADGPRTEEREEILDGHAEHTIEIGRGRAGEPCLQKAQQVVDRHRSGAVEVGRARQA